jgi:DNA-binding transcriptional LysR family regulator
VALARFSLVADHLASGVLVRPLPFATPTAFAYYLVGLPEAVKLSKIARFSQWLKAEAEETARIMRSMSQSHAGSGTV